MSPQPKERYLARIDELESLKLELEVQKRPGDPAPIVGRVLEGAGDLLRRQAALSHQGALVDAALKLVPEAALKSWGDAVSVGEIEGRLSRAASQAVEAAIPDSADDGAAFAGWAMQDLMARDRLESALTALELMAGRGRADAKALHGRLRSAIDAVDSTSRRIVTGLTALNPERRAESNLLDAACRARAWWFSERCGVEDDLLVKVLGGEAKGSLGVRERSAHDAVTARRKRRVTEDELLRFDLGLASPGEAAALKSQGKRDPEMAKILAALEEGERALEELTRGDQPPTLRSASGSQPVEPRSAKPEIIEERSEFKLLLFRSAKRVQVVVQPRRQDRFAAAAVFLPDSPQQSVPSQPGDHGLTFELGPSERVAGQTARVVVKLADGQSIATEIHL